MPIKVVVDTSTIDNDDEIILGALPQKKRGSSFLLPIRLLFFGQCHREGSQSLRLWGVFGGRQSIQIHCFLGLSRKSMWCTRLVSLECKAMSL